jgi:fatty acid desaturase
MRNSSPSALLPATSRTLFRDSGDALANTLILLATAAAWLGSFGLMASHGVLFNLCGIVLCAHSMVLAAYLVHEAAHQTLFTAARANHWVGEAMSFVAGSPYASFERIRLMHIRHHLDRADLSCFDFKGLMRRHPALRRSLQLLEWAYIPATEMLMHMQVVCRPFWVRSQRRHLPRVAVMLVVRGSLLVAFGIVAPRALVLYALAVVLQLHVLNFFDAFHHTFEQYFIEPGQPLSTDQRDRAYEQRHTYSNLLSSRYPWLNLLVLNFCYHNAHHYRPSVPWWRLQAVHRRIFGVENTAVMPLSELLITWHRNRVRRVFAADYGAPRAGARGADSFIGAHGVSFLTVV